MELPKLQERGSTTSGARYRAYLRGFPDCLVGNGALSTDSALHACQRVQKLEVPTLLDDDLPRWPLTLFIESPAC